MKEIGHGEVEEGERPYILREPFLSFAFCKTKESTGDESGTEVDIYIS
jgi:hypothetical protein